MSGSAYELLYLAQPFTACKPAVANALAQAGWTRLAQQAITSREYYSIGACWRGAGKGSPSKIPLDTQENGEVSVEIPDFHHLQEFYEEHGLEPLTEPELAANQVVAKLQKALGLLAIIEPVYRCVCVLVATIQVLRQPEAEIDVSYSHPKIPFSIFVSVCADDSPVSSLRVAEAILHEAMHLHLTLLEGELTLIHPASENQYYSPWREEDRPVQGILHGLFVFRAVHDFYVAFFGKQSHAPEMQDFLASRLAAIESEIDSLKYFSQVPDLTEAGKSLVLNLLEY